MRLEVLEYMRPTSNLFGLSYDEGALTRVEREAIVSFAQVVGKEIPSASSAGRCTLGLALKESRWAGREP